MDREDKKEKTNNKEIDYVIVQSLNRPRRTNYKPYIIFFLTGLRFSIEIFCYIYEYFYSKKNESDYLKAYSIYKNEKESVKNYRKYLIYEIIQIFFKGFAAIILLLYNASIFNLIKRANLSSRILHFLDLIMQIFLNLRTFNLFWQMIDLSNAKGYIYLSIAILVMAYYIFKKTNITNDWIYFGFGIIILIRIFGNLGVQNVLNKRIYKKFIDSAGSDYIAEVKIVCEKSNIKIENILILYGENRVEAYTFSSLTGYAIFIGKGYFKKMNPKELAAIIAHEIGHIKNRSFYSYQIIDTIHEIINLIATLKILRKKKYEFDRIVSMFSLSFIFHANRFFYNLIECYIRKINEYFADNYAKSIGYGDALASGFIKINDSDTTGIIHSKVFQILFTHPPIIDRIQKSSK